MYRLRIENLESKSGKSYVLIRHGYMVFINTFIRCRYIYIYEVEKKNVFIHSTYNVTCILLLQNLPYNQSFPFILFSSTPCVCLYSGFRVDAGGEVFFPCVEEEEGCSERRKQERRTRPGAHFSLLRTHQ